MSPKSTFLESRNKVLMLAIAGNKVPKIFLSQKIPAVARNSAYAPLSSHNYWDEGVGRPEVALRLPDVNVLATFCIAFRSL